jgi:hypothetical protein
LENRLVYDLKVFMGYQRILNPKNTETLEGGRNKIKKGIL